MIGVLAGTLEEFERWCRDHPSRAGCRRSLGRWENVICINTVMSARGFMLDELVEIGTWYELNNAREIRDEAMYSLRSWNPGRGDAVEIDL
jgi:hypothetical protein